MNCAPRILAAVVSVLALAAAPPSQASEPVFRVVSVHDGDSLRTREHGPVRFAITSAPEIGRRARCPREEAKAIEARDYVRPRTANGVILRTGPGERGVDYFGRLLRRVFAVDGGDIEAELIERGLAVRFVHGARAPNWCRP